MLGAAMAAAEQAKTLDKLLATDRPAERLLTIVASEEQ
jgi:hypothetical protein